MTSERARAISRAASRRWKANNPEKVRERQDRYNARRRAASPVGVVHIENCRRCNGGFSYVHGGRRRYLCDLCRDYTREWEKFGLTGPQVAALRKRDKCEICGEAAPRGRGAWHIDHDHTTGAIRGVLCTRCNSGLGMFQDRPQILLAAVRYLLRPNMPGDTPDQSTPLPS